MAAIEEAWKEGIKVKSCFLCRYYALANYRNDAGPIFCKFLKKQIKSTNAANCEYYRPDESVLGNYERPERKSYY